MYEDSFGLKRRPFAATPDATCFLSAKEIQAALDELVVCVEQGQGIAVLTAPAGTGKTLLCERLRFELDDRFETVFLRHASFLTRRALLQTVLCELNHAYHHPSEQELRLELFPAIRALQPKREALVLICDEAHQLTDSLLEELRILADFAESGRPLVRLVLVGQLSLEEKLAQPSLEAFNQRIRAQINLSTFDHAGSLDYIDYRLTWSGGRTDEIFTPAALDLIVRASDGVPRCINQLADHTLLLAFVAEQRPAGEELVREALGDLRQLPLHWNEPSRSVADPSEPAFPANGSQNLPISSNRDVSGYLSGSTARAAMYSYEPEADLENDLSKWTSVEIGAREQPSVTPNSSVTYESDGSTNIDRIQVGSDDWRQTVELFNPQTQEAPIGAAMTGLMPEPIIVATEDENKSKLTRRLQFHDLLQDAYAAAGKSMSSLTESATSQLTTLEAEIEGELIESLNTVEVLSESGSVSSVIEKYESSKTFGDKSLAMQLTSRFQEEVIIDRYASIDAGFGAPPTSQPDTTNVNKVRGERFEIGENRFIVTNHQTIEMLDQIQTVESFLGAAPDHRYDGRSVEFVPMPHSSTMNEDFDHAEESDSPYSDSADSFDSIPMSAHVKSQMDRSSVERDEPSSQLWNRAESEEAKHSNVTRGTSESDRVEQVADEVFSLGESLQPTGALSSSSESILKALRREVVDQGAARTADFGDQPPSPPVEAAWESIETTPVQSSAEARPFRYLFSMLRRKQQGLA